MKTTQLYVGVFLVFLVHGKTFADLGYRSEHISVQFYIAGETADGAKDKFRDLLDTFPQNLQGNLTRELDNIPPYLDSLYNASSVFASMAERFFNVAKNESGNLLLKLRQVPSEETITDNIKSQLTDYFTEMENFHVVLSGILDDTMEFTLDSALMVQRTCMQYTDVHNNIVERRKTHPDEWCRNRCNEFLWQSADEIFQCATGKMRVTFDIYSITKTTTYHVMKMLEHRIQKIYNCFLFGNYPIRCRFVGNAEVDFQKLHSRLDDLLMYNEKQKRKIFRKRCGFGKCIPDNFPDDQMPESLKSCFQFS